MERRQFFAISATLVAPPLFAAAPNAMIGVKPSDLIKVDPQRIVTTTDVNVWTRSGNRGEGGLLPGVFENQWRDKEALFFVGHQLAVYLRLGPNHYVVSNGGLWLPIDSSARPRLFMVQDGNLRRGATLTEALNSAPDKPWVLLDVLLQWVTEGHVVLMQEIEDEMLVAKLRSAFSER